MEGSVYQRLWLIVPFFLSLGLLTVLPLSGHPARATGTLVCIWTQIQTQTD